MGTGDKIYFHRDCIELLNRNLEVPSDLSKLGSDYIQTQHITRKKDGTFELKEFSQIKMMTTENNNIDVTKAERGPVKFCYLPYYTTKGMYKKLKQKKDRN